MAGQTVTIINRSEIVGRPLAAMLANDGATVYSVDIDSTLKMERGKLEETETTVEGAVRASQVVITGVPTKAYRLPSELIQPGTVVINVASYKNVDEESLLAIPGVRYVPMVGKVTVAMLLRNVRSTAMPPCSYRIPVRRRLCMEHRSCCHARLFACLSMSDEMQS